MKQDMQSLRNLMRDVAYPGYEFMLARDYHRTYLQIVCEEGTCNVTGEPMIWKSRKWFISFHMTDSEVVQTCFKAVLTAMEHEARERFTFRGTAVFGPHLDVYQLKALVDAGCRDVRKEAT